MIGEINQTSSDRYFTIQTMIGGLTLECFIATRSFSRRLDSFTHFTEEHEHSSYELLICREGSGYQLVNGQSHWYERNTVFVFAPFARHASISEKTAEEMRYSIRFEVLNKEHAAPGLRSALRYLSDEGCFHFVADAALLNLTDQLADVMHRVEPSIELVAGGLLTAILSYSFQNLCLIVEGPTDNRSVLSLLGDVNRRKFLLDYYFDHMMYGDGDAGIEALCGQLHLSHSQLNRVIKETYGSSFKKKSIEVRLAYIKYFLKYSDLPITEIAQRTNFASDSSFSLFFKQHDGLSPSQYRKQERVELPPLISF